MPTIPKAKIEALRAALAQHERWSAPDYPTPMSDAEGVESDLATASAEVVSALLSEREEMLALLREVEWYGRDMSDRDCCPFCNAPEAEGHATSCRLAALLRE